MTGEVLPGNADRTVRDHVVLVTVWMVAFEALSLASCSPRGMASTTDSGGGEDLALWDHPASLEVPRPVPVPDAAEDDDRRNSDADMEVTRPRPISDVARGGEQWNSDADFEASPSEPIPDMTEGDEQSNSDGKDWASLDCREEHSDATALGLEDGDARIDSSWGKDGGEVSDIEPVNACTPKFVTFNGMIATGGLDWEGDKVVCGSQGGWIHLFDVSNPESPALTAQTMLPVSTWGELALSGDWVLAAGYVVGSSQIRFSTAKIGQGPELEPIAKLQWPADWDNCTKTTHLELDYPRAMVAHPDVGVRLIDVTDLAAPAAVGAYSPADGLVVQSLASEGALAYVLERSSSGLWLGAESRLEVVDFTDPQSPFVLGAVESEDELEDVALVSDGMLAATTWADGVLSVFDLKDPWSPSLMWVNTDLGMGHDIAACNGRLWLGCGENAGGVFDVSPEGEATLASTVEKCLWGTAWSPDCQYLVGAGTDLFIQGFSADQPTELLSQLDTPAHAHHLAMVGDRVLVSCAPNNIYDISVASPEAPEILNDFSTVEKGAIGLDVVAQGSLALVAWTDLDCPDSTCYVVASGFDVFDVSVPGVPLYHGSYELDEGREAAGLDFASGAALVFWRSPKTVPWGQETGGMDFVNMALPGSPTLLGDWETDHVPQDGILTGSTVLLAWVSNGTAQIRVLDVADPSVPLLVGSLDLPGSPYGKMVSLARAGSQLYANVSKVGLYVVDVSNPELPQVVSLLDVETSGQAAGVSGNTILLSGPIGSGFALASVEDPQSPEVLGEYPGPRWVEDVVFGGEYAFVAAGEQGLAVIRSDGCW